MVTLMDIAPVSEFVTVRGMDLEVTGISVHGVAVLLSEFPELRALVSNKEQGFTAARLVELIPHGVAAVIAAGLGKPGDKAYIDKAATLNVGEQLNLLEPILKLSFPGGLGPFVERVAAHLEGFDVLTKVPASK